MRQLTMKTRLDRPLPEMPPLPPRMSIHTADGHQRASWNWIIKASFDEKQDYSMIEDDPECAPERVFFMRHARMDVATAAAPVTAEGVGWLHMVGVHPAYEGMGCGFCVSLAALRSLQALGVRECLLKTDDFRLPAVKIYLDLGFEPMYEPDDEEMKSRWEAVFAKLKEYKKPDHTPIRL